LAVWDERGLATISLFNNCLSNILVYLNKIKKEGEGDEEEEWRYGQVRLVAAACGYSTISLWPI